MIFDGSARVSKTLWMAGLFGSVLLIASCSNEGGGDSTTPASPTASQSEAVTGKVIAKVGDISVTEQEMALAQEDLQSQFAGAPPEKIKALILNALIDIKLLAAEARNAGIANEQSVKSRLAFFEARTLHNEWYLREAFQKISEEDVKARYDAEVANAPKEQEIRARHILVETEDEAKAIIAELEGGADFAELAKTKSTGPSGPNGGDLGYFGKGQMVPEFEVAAFALEKGTFGKEPVKTQFGWHIIFKEDERDRQPPAFEQIKDNIRQAVARERYLALTKAAREKFEIEILDEELKSQVDSLQ